MSVLTESASGFSFEERLDVLQRLLSPDEFESVRAALSMIVSRMTEAHLLADDVMRSIARYRDVYAGRAHEIIVKRVEQLGITDALDSSDLEHLRLLLLEGAQVAGRVARVAPDTEHTLFRRYAEAGRSHLRCRLCGYHFRSEDLSYERIELAATFGITLATKKLPLRLEDRLKNPQDTSFQIDHIVPRAGWGPTREENLEFLCQYCNRGKSIYRWWGELLPMIIAGSLPSVMGDVLYWQINAALVATWMRDSSKCEECSRDSSSVELAAVPLEQWITPLRLRTKCYECIGAMY